MRYNLDWLKDQINQGYKLKYIFFWREFLNTQISKSYLIQWYTCSFYFSKVYIQYCLALYDGKKAFLFRYEEVSKRIINASTPAEAKSLGRLVQNFNESTWNLK